MVTSITVHSPAEMIKKLLVSLGQGVEANSGGIWPVYAGQEPDQPDNLIRIRQLGGLQTGRHQVTGQVQFRPGVEIVVRATREPSTGTAGHTLGWEKISLVCNALDTQVLNTQISIATYTYIIHACSRIGDISMDGQDPTNKERHICSVPYNFSVTQI